MRISEKLQLSLAKSQGWGMLDFRVPLFYLHAMVETSAVIESGRFESTNHIMFWIHRPQGL